MDVICDQCKAEYEFDETLLGERGTTVKCSACGHVFRVMPPNHEAGRSQLKLRFAQDGRVKVLSSLRELQQRIRNGEVGLDDELGRDGFPFRPLREVPELRNFFARAPEKTTVRPDADETNALAERARADVPARAEAQPSAPAPRRPEQVLQGTMMGVGPGEQRAPFAPRAPNVEARAGARERSDVLGATLGPTAAMMRGPDLHEDAPTTVSAIPPSETRERSLAGSKTPTHLGTPPPRDFGLGGRPPPGGPAPAPMPPAPVAAPVHAPVPPAAAGYDRAPQHASAPDPRSFAGPEPGPPGFGGPERPRGFAGPEPAPPGFGGPERPRGFAGPEPARRHRDAPGKGPAMPSARPMRLYVDDDEIPLERRLRRGSRLWLFPLLLLLGGGVWIGLRGLDGVTKALEQAGQALDPEPAAPAPEESALADAGSAESSEAGAQLATPTGEDEAAGQEAPTEEPEEAQPAEAPQPAAAAGAAATPVKDGGIALARPEPGRKPTASAPKPEIEARAPAPTRDPSAEARARASAAPSDPKDYGQWVARGDQMASRGDQTGAAEAYKAALALRPTGSEANAGLGFTLLSTGKTREALPYFDRAANSGYAEASIGLGDAYRKLGQPSSAAEAYQSYLDRLPNGARAAYARGQLDKLGKGSRTSSDEGSGASPSPEPGGYRPAGELTEPSAPAPGSSEVQ